MIIRTFTSVSFILFTLGFFTGCADPNSGSVNNPVQTYQESEAALKATGASFSTYTYDEGNSISVLLSFDNLNKKVRNSKSATQKLKYLTAAQAAMIAFEVKAEALIESVSLDANSHNQVVTKRNLVQKRLKPINDLIAAQEEMESVEIAEAARHAANPFTVKIASMEFNLCDINYENPDVTYGRRKVLEIQYDLQLAKMLLCSSGEDILKNTSSEMSESPEVHTSIRLYTKRKKDQHHRQIILPRDKDALKNKIITDDNGEYYDNETRTTFSITVEMPYLELLLLANKSKIDSNGFIKFLDRVSVGSHARGRFDSKLMSYLESVYEQKDAILSKFENSRIKRLLSDKFEAAILKTTDEIIQFVVSKDYESLRRFSTASNVNNISYNRNIKINSDLSAFGFSPLMVAAILGDDQAVNILLEVEGINPSLESPVFKKNYITISSMSANAIGHLQRFSDSYSSGTGNGGKGSSFGTGNDGGRGSSFRTGNDGGRGSSFRTGNVPAKYRGYTALMIAVAENQCELVDTIIEAEPYTLNHKNSKGISVLRVSLRYGNCLEKLLKAGAFDISIFTRNYFYGFAAIAANNGLKSTLDFLKYVDDVEFETLEVKKELPKVLLLTNLDLELKLEFVNRVPWALAEVRSFLNNEKMIQIDFNFLKEIDFNLAEDKTFGSRDNPVTFFSYILSSVVHSGKSTSSRNSERVLKGVFMMVYEVNPKWVMDWVNSSNSFKGQNPLVVASMFNEEGIVKALVSIEGINVNVVDQKTGYNALEWQYVVNPFMWHFTYSEIASTLSEKGGAVRPEKANFIGKPNAAAKSGMESKWREVSYPFGRESATTKKPE